MSAEQARHKSYIIFISSAYSNPYSRRKYSASFTTTFSIQNYHAL